jgi:hypothetical protein
MSKLNLYVRAADVGPRLPALKPGQAYTVRATLVLDTGTDGQSGDWGPAFIEGVFPACERSHSIARRIGLQREGPGVTGQWEAHDG